MRNKQDYWSAFGEQLSQDLHNQVATKLGTDQITIFINYKHGKTVKYIGVEYQRAYLESKKWKKELRDDWYFLREDNTLRFDIAVTGKKIASDIQQGQHYTDSQIFNLTDYFNKQSLTERQKAEKAILEAYGMAKDNCLPLPLMVKEHRLKGIAYIVFSPNINIEDEQKKELIVYCNRKYVLLSREYGF